ncbi:acetyl-CoA carboxylase carboxyltransferase subunit alpha [Anoxybacter fermentans]|uniref:Acetyl-coenzyme A carboxylase carboxyl transferase subunit alpha n=1 Tax=Anoxybacter fermentans TaxID=1323375 RepID=A0A3Q9HSZ9_9FIRM|nr:acetyl-CoA carboxylase carboxyltransferase subunit alpha [Anoxybacter fermentans]AZR74622.1 acetyl-CoA carboxylase carboxyltransferase subunit alpha [Anoxybacter fermentans]
MNILEFERPIYELEKKIEELRAFMEEQNIDLSEEIQRLEEKLVGISENIYNNLHPWQILQIARHPERPLTSDYIELICDDFIELHGDRRFGDDPAIIGGIGLIEGNPVTIIGHQKGKTTKENLKRNFGMAHPEGYRKALRLMKQAEKFNRPIITFINTPGAYPGIGAEERGQAEAIARNLFEMSKLRVPILVYVIGEGGSGGALGIGVGDKIIMFQFSYYSVCSPEACASILWRNAAEAKAASEALRLTASDLLELGIVDDVLIEPRGGAHKDPTGMAKTLKESILKNLNDLRKLSREELLARRYNKYRKIGQFLMQQLNKNKME